MTGERAADAGGSAPSPAPAEHRLDETPEEQSEHFDEAARSAARPMRKELDSSDASPAQHGVGRDVAG